MTIADFGITEETLTLANGVPLVVFHRPGAPVSIRVGFQAGSRFDPTDSPGMAHFCEHMICSGAKEFPTKEYIGLFVEEHGAYFNASTGADILQMVVDFGDIDDAPEICHFLGQLLTTSLFEPANTDQERGAIKAELGRAISSPSTYIYRLWKQVAYQGTPIGHDTLGTDQSLTDMTADQLRQFYIDNLVAHWAGIVVSGGMTAESIAPLLEPAIQTANSITDANLEISTNRNQPLMIRNYPGSSQVHLAVGFASVPFGHPDYWALSLLSRIMGRGRTSRLYRRLRQELGLIYALAGFQEEYMGAGRWLVLTDCHKKDVGQVLTVMAEELTKVTDAGVTADELGLSQTFVNKFQKLRMEQASAWSDYHIERVTYRSTVGNLVDDNVARNAVTVEDVNRVARTYLQPGTWYVAACGEVGEGEVEFRY